MFFSGDISQIILMIPPMLLALTAHEWAHAYVALRLGDNTASMLGRVTMNPLKHLDPVGTLAIFITGMFGWAKPVPVNPRNFKHPSRDLMIVSLAGPAMNIALACVFALILKVLIHLGPGALGGISGVYEPLFIMARIGLILNVALAVFNMIPIPPLDGSKVLSHFLPLRAAASMARLEPYGFMILILLMVTNTISYVMSPAITFVVKTLMIG